MKKIIALLLIVSVGGVRATPPLPAIETNVVASVWTEEYPPFTPPPPKIAQFSFYDDNGMMFDITKDDLVFATYQYDYILEAKYEAFGPWVDIGNVTNGNHSISDIIARHESAFFRVRKKKQPHPPYGMWSRTSETNSVNSRPKGYFR